MWQTAFKTQQGTLDTLLGWAAGTTQSDTLFGVWQTLEDGPALGRCCFLPSLDRGMLQGAIMDGESIAASMLTLIVNVVGVRLSAMSHYCMDLPYVLVCAAALPRATCEGGLPTEAACNSGLAGEGRGECIVRDIGQEGAG